MSVSQRRALFRKTEQPQIMTVSNSIAQVLRTASLNHYERNIKLHDTGKYRGGKKKLMGK